MKVDVAISQIPLLHCPLKSTRLGIISGGGMLQTGRS